jgi:DNA-binding XRE family transcriptional regulator
VASECTACGAGGDEPKVALVDYYMTVNQTGLRFVAALQAQLRSWGPVFPTLMTKAAYRRAGSTLAHMALISGHTFEFLRVAIEYTQADAAALLGVTVADVVAWESGAVEVPLNLWYHMAEKVCQMDGRLFTPYLTLPDQTLRPNVIRVHPDFPLQSSARSGSPCPCRC